MQIQTSTPHRILVTGGTSGLGAEIVKLFLSKGWNVTATGRNTVSFPQYAELFRFVRIDFADLGDVARHALEMTVDGEGFDLVVNNAGMLGFPNRVLTTDGLEYTFQVNFLAHLLLNEIIIRNKKDSHPLKIVPVLSPVYRCCSLKNLQSLIGERYGSFRSYSLSKFYLALMCSYLTSKYPRSDVSLSGFNPGVFRSGISRTRGHLFRFLYSIAAPFMYNPARIAERFEEVSARDEPMNGFIYSRSGSRKKAPVAGNDSAGAFWKMCYDKIDRYL